MFNFSTKKKKKKLYLFIEYLKNTYAYLHELVINLSITLNF